MSGFEPISESDEEIVRQIIGAAIEVHRELGPGLIEGIYRKAMAYELSARGLAVQQEESIFVQYKSIRIAGQRVDLIVAGRVIVELKCVDDFAPIHQAQLLSYLKTLNLRIGLLINFKTQMVKDGIKRVVR